MEEQDSLPGFDQMPALIELSLQSECKMQGVVHRKYGPRFGGKDMESMKILDHN